MNILYIVDTYSVLEPMGVLQLSAITKQLGHQSFIASIDKDDIRPIINDNKIDLVACSLLSTEAESFHQMIEELRKDYPKIPIIAGGPHPTYYPQIVNQWPIDAVVVGEGDLVIGDILKAWADGKDFSHIKNVHTKQRKNEQRHLVSDLDQLPFADRDLLRNVAPFKHIRMKSFFATRGCPFNCTYCFNSVFKKLHFGMGKVLRRRSVENLIQEIEQVKANNDIDFVRFGDDMFVLKYNEWVEEFVEKYSSRIKLPFYFLIHPERAEEKLVREIKKAGCHSVMMAIESGNADIRANVLRRNISNEKILESFKIFKDHDIKVFSNTILGLPDSTIEDDILSLNFTLDCAPSYSGFTVFTPFPGTELHKYCEDKGYVEKSEAFLTTFPKSMQQDSCLNFVTERDKKIHRNILLLAPLANWIPLFRNCVVKHLIYWRPNIIFTLIGFFVRNYLNMKIWPFKKSVRAFLYIFLSVLRIDKKNFAPKK